MSAVWVVDDGSPEPIARDSLPQDPRVLLHRMEVNSGVSAARMAAISRSTSEFVACVNVDILPDPAWAARCLSYLAANQRVGAVYTRTQPAEPGRVLARWRMRFHESNFDRPTGPAPFAPGHAVLFRRQAILAVGGYDPLRRKVGEDSDLCERMRSEGWDTYYLGTGFPRCVSIQPDRIGYLARKQLLRDGYDPQRTASRKGLLRRSVRGLANRLGRNLIKGRWSFLPVDVAVFVLGVWFVAREHRATEP